MKPFLKLIFILLVSITANTIYPKDSILNVSYDPTREFYRGYNRLFAKHWKEKTGREVDIKQSHGGSGKQARSVIDGLQADVVTLSLAYDIDAIAKKSNKLSPDWQKRLNNNSCPYTSTIVFLVRKGNPKGIKDWDDLVKPGIEVITPNPKTSGGGRWNYMAVWGYAYTQTQSESRAKEFVTALYKNVKILDSGARGATTTFVNRKIGDVLITWENEAYLSLREEGFNDPVEMIVPSKSIYAEPPVALVDVYVDKHKTREIAEEYLNFLYSTEAQELAAQNFYRPYREEVLVKYKSQFKELKLFTIEEIGGSWKKVQEKHFSEKGVFDQIYTKQ